MKGCLYVTIPICRQHSTLHAFEQFGSLYMHSINDPTGRFIPIWAQLIWPYDILTWLSGRNASGRIIYVTSYNIYIYFNLNSPNKRYIIYDTKPIQILCFNRNVTFDSHENDIFKFRATHQLSHIFIKICYKIIHTDIYILYSHRYTDTPNCQNYHYLVLLGPSE